MARARRARSDGTCARPKAPPVPSEREPQPSFFASLIVSCELKHAGKLASARGLDLASSRVLRIGTACRICERPDGPQRAAQPVSRTLVVDDFRKTVSPYPFAPV